MVAGVLPFVAQYPLAYAITSIENGCWEVPLNLYADNVVLLAQLMQELVDESDNFAVGQAPVEYL